ncbi:MAG: DinB family protein [Pseudomonadales bacterium]
MPQNMLVVSNIEALTQLRALLDRLNDEQYGTIVCDIAVSTLGCHVRHVIEHYECFINDLDNGLIDYDARSRDSIIESRRDVARERVAEIEQRLIQLNRKGVSGQEKMQIRLRTDMRTIDVPPVESSLARELVFLHGHTTHHFAQMALHMRAMGLSIDKQFGMAASTQAYHQQAEKSSRTIAS